MHVDPLGAHLRPSHYQLGGTSKNFGASADDYTLPTVQKVTCPTLLVPMPPKPTSEAANNLGIGNKPLYKS